MRSLIPKTVPTGELRTMADSLFSDFWREIDDVFSLKPKPLANITSGKYSYPRVNIRNLDNEYTIEAAVPGLTKENVQVDYADGVLTISAQSQNEKNEEENGYIVRELHKSSFSRSITVDPELCDVEAIEAGVKDGVLSVKIPKKVLDKPPEKRIIEIT